MRNRALIALIGVALFTCTAVGSPAAIGADLLPWQGSIFEADPKLVLSTVAKLPAADPENNPYLLWDERVEIDADHRTRTTLRKVYQIQSRDDVESRGKIFAYWTPWMEKKPKIRARVITTDGKSHELDQTTVTESAGPNVGGNTFADTRMVSAPLPAVDVGAIVETEVVLEDHTSFCPVGVTGILNWETLSDNRKRYLEIRAPESIDLRIAAVGRDVDTTVHREGEQKVWRYEQDDPDRLEDFWAYLPPEVPNISYVVYSTGRSWRDVGVHYNKMVERQIEGAELSDLATEIRRQADTPRDQLQKAVRLLADRIRFTGVEFGANAILPHRPATTLVRRYGDCKDQAVLLVAILRELGIESNVALLCVQTHVDLAPKSPGLNSFDHAIVYVPAQAGIDEMWIDLTAPFTAFGALPLADQERLALIVSPTVDGLKRTPGSTSADNRREQLYTYHLATDGSSRAIVEADSIGSSAEYLRSIYAGQSREQLIEGLKENRESMYGLTEVKSYKFSDPRETSDPTFQIRYEFLADDLAFAGDGQLMVELYPGAAFNYLPIQFVQPFSAAEGFEDGPEREQPFDLRHAFSFQTRYRLIAPEGFQVEELPENVEFGAGGFRASAKFRELDDRTVEITVLVDTGEGVATAAQVEEFRDEYLSLSGNQAPDNWAVTVNFAYLPKRLIDEGKEPEGMRQIVEMAETDPRALFYRSELCDALMSVGLGEEARRMAREMVEAAPQSARSHTTEALVNMRDLLGTDLRFGMNRKVGLAAFERATELNANDPILKYNQAVLLEHDDLGGRYADPKDLRQAEKIYKQINETQPFDLALRNYGALLMTLGETRELRRLAAIYPDRFDTLAYYAASVLNDSGMAAASRIVSRAQAQDRLLINNTLATRLRGLRRYDLLREFTKAHPEVQPHKNLQVLKRREEVALDDADPCAVLQDMMATWLQSGMNPETIRGFYANAADAAVFHNEVEKLPQFFQSVRDIVIQNYGALQVAGDIVSFYEFDVDGNDEEGYWVTATPRKETEGMPAVTRLVVREGDRFLLFAEGKDAAQLGHKALQLAEQGNFKAAATWLDPVYRVDKRQVGMFSPFSGSPFARVWFFAKVDDAKAVRLASLLLAARAADDQQMLADLERIRPDYVPLQQLQIDRARLGLLRRLGRHQDVLDLASELLETHPTAGEALSAQCFAEVKLGMLAEGEATLKKLESQNKIQATLERRRLLFAKGGHEAVFEYDLKRAREQPNVYTDSMLAWRSLFVDKSRDVVAEAKRAVEASPIGNRNAALHTLACVYADSGQLRLAAATLRQTIKERNGIRDPIDDWVLGRIAEHCGLKDAAKKYYERVKQSRRDRSIDASCADLAALRLMIVAER